jgi:hypothetical protein
MRSCEALNLSVRVFLQPFQSLEFALVVSKGFEKLFHKGT